MRSLFPAISTWHRKIASVSRTRFFQVQPTKPVHMPTVAPLTNAAVIEYAGMHACASQPNPSTEITDVLS
jgi:hypothetical protein